MNETSNMTALFESYYNVARPVYAVAVPILLVLCLAGVIANVLILATVRFVGAMNSTLVFTYSLASADLWTSLILAVGLVMNSYWRLVLGLRPLLGDNQDCYMHVVEALRLGAIITSVLHLLTLAINHLIATVSPHKHKRSWLNRCTGRVIMLLWLVPPGGFLLVFAALHDQTFTHPQCQAWLVTRNAFRATILVLIAVPLFVTGLVYVRIVSVLKSLHEKVSTRRQSFIQRRMKTVVTALLIVGTFLLGWFPGVVWMMITCQSCILPLDWLFKYNPRLVWICGITVNGLFISKGILNPTVYALRMPNIQQAFRRMALCGKRPPPGPTNRPTVASGSTLVFRNLLAQQLLANQLVIDDECIIRIEDRVTML